MESVLLIVHQIIIMFALMILGFILKKRGFIQEPSVHDLTNILLYIVMPTVLLSAYCEPFSQEKAFQLFLCFITSIAIHLFFIFLARIIYPKDGIRQNALILPNSGYMGIPLVTSVFGNEAVFYLSAFACGIFQSVYHADKYDLHRNWHCSIICCMVFTLQSQSSEKSCDQWNFVCDSRWNCRSFVETSVHSACN